MVDRVARWCQARSALPVLAIASFLESLILPIPIDLIMGPMVATRPTESWRLVLVATAGSVLGAVLGYLLGAFAYDLWGLWIIAKMGGADHAEALLDLTRTHGWMMIVIAGLTAVPFNLSTVVAGAASMRPDMFLLAVCGTRLLRFVLLAFLYRGAASVLRGLGRNFGPSTALAALICVLGFVVAAIIWTP